MGFSKGKRALLTIKSKMGLNRDIRAPLTTKSRMGLGGGMAWAVIKKASITVFRWGIHKEIDLGASGVLLKETDPILKR